MFINKLSYKRKGKKGKELHKTTGNDSFCYHSLEILKVMFTKKCIRLA